VPLVTSASGLGSGKLREIYNEHRSGIVEILGRIEDPGAAVTVATRLMLAKELAQDFLATCPDDPSSLPDRDLYLWVNLSYDVMISTLDLYKRSVQVPYVPAPRR
jgi:hypothetical protein